MKPIPFRCDFFHVVGKGWDPTRIGQVMSKLAALPEHDRAARGFQSDLAFYRLHRFVPAGSGNWVGDIVRIRQNEPAKKGDPDGHLESIPLEREQGLAEETAFLVSPSTKSVVMQRNHFGAGAGVLESLVHQNDEHDPAFAVQHVMDQGSNARFLAAKGYAKLRIRMKVIADPAARKAHDLALEEVLGWSNELDGAQLELTIAKGRRKDPLKASALKRAVVRLLRRDDVESIKVSLIGESADQKVVDLVSHRLFETAQLTPNDSRELTFEKRRRALESAFEKQFGYLAKE